MFADATTLNDLGFVSDTQAFHSVATLVNFTTTRVGHQCLTSMLSRYHSSARAIKEQQDAFKAVAAHLDSYRALLATVNPDATRTYLDLNWQQPSSMRTSSRLLGGLGVLDWHREYMRDISYGKVLITALLSFTDLLIERLRVTQSTVLHELAERLRAVLEHSSLDALVHSSANRLDLEEFDELARWQAKQPLLELVQLVGEMEALWSISAACLRYEWTFPNPGSHLDIDGLYHPVLGAASVRNSLRVASHVRVCFITGPNMAGKSTFMKSVGLALALAHLGCAVPARNMIFPVGDALFSSLNVRDDLTSGTSFYLAEVHRLRTMIDTIRRSKHVTALLDEPFKGTNVYDATEATLALLERLVGCTKTLVFLSSHISDLPETMLGDGRLLLLSFAATFDNDGLHFSYLLRRGLSSQRLGIILLQKEGILADLERICSSGNDCGYLERGRKE